ncbi:polysaccharide pyruvyl transferase family protein [Niallia sp.]|uniref:polysaccharide pyruvyl transferase family protein n=1 Tax=Niallia sp. TaxID=2837523 RepID=UPI0028A279A5|nr:polysaccharide pyruvyl transferase family protein [Niallia sp.]
MNILYLGYLGVNNIGDEVCYEAFAQACERWLNEEYTLFSYPINSTKSLKEFYAENPFDLVVLGGGSLFQGHFFIDLALEAIEMKLPLYCYGTGIDYMTEETVESFKKGDFQLSSTTFNNKEINREKIKKVVEYATFAGLRGPLTLKYIKALNPSPASNYQTIGDSGMLFTPEKDDYIKRKYLKDLSKKIIAVNWGTTQNILFGYDEYKLKNQMIDACTNLLKKGYQIVIFPMWNKDVPSCMELYNSIKEKGKVTFIPEVCTATQIYHFLSICHFSLNLKLHANVLSASSGTPFIQLAYRSKGVDFAASIHQLPYTLLTNTTKLAETIERKEYYLTSNKNRKKIRLAKERIVARHKNFIASLKK